MINDIIRDLKKFTSKELVKAIKEIPEIRREWLSNKFEYGAGPIKRGVKYKIWQDGFHPIELNTNKMLDEKLDFIIIQLKKALHGRIRPRKTSQELR